MADFRLDEATKAKLVGLMPVLQGATVSFTPDVFVSLPDQVRPVFKQRALTRGEKAESVAFEEGILREMAPFTKREGDKITVDTGDGAKTTEFMALNRKKREREADIARKTIVGWTGVYDAASGAEIVFKADADGGADKDLYDGFCAEAKAQLYENCRVISSLNQVEKQGLKSLPESAKG